MKRLPTILTLCALAAVIAAGLVRGSGAMAQADDRTGDPEAIWRSIFSRPEAKAVSDLEAKRRDLGAVLFSDPRLSAEMNRSCASCHKPERGYTDGRTTALGRDGSSLKRNTPHLYNLAEATSFYWDGREPTLQSQARVPLHAANELAGDSTAFLRKLSADPGFMQHFAAAFPTEKAVSEEAILDSLAAYERSLVSPETKFDAWVKGNDRALDETEKRGFRIFVGKGGCISCHGGWRMTDDAFHDIGIDSDDPGRSVIAGGTAGIPAFKTPGLRQVAHTAPYMHNGSLATLDDVVAHYAGKLALRPSLAPSLVRGLKLDADERAALVAFLRTL